MGPEALLRWQGLGLDLGAQRLEFGSGVLQAGSHLLLRGPSGAGKSSLIALLAGLRLPSRGEVWLAGRALGAMAAGQRDRWRAQQLGLLPQRLHLVEGLSLRDNLSLAYRVLGLAVDRPRLEELAERLGLQGLLDRPPAALSVGQLQRAALARALLRRPRLLLLDEPSSSLDDANTATLLTLVRELAAEQGASLLVATHDARVAAGLRALPGLQQLQLGPPR